MQSCDGIIKFKHNEKWAKKKILKYSRKYLLDLDKSKTEIKKVYFPFYFCTIEINAHMFETLNIPTRNGSGEGPYCEEEYDAKLKTFICDNKSIDQKCYGKIASHVKKFKPLVDFGDYRDAEFVEFSNLMDDISYQHAQDVIVIDGEYKASNQDIIKTIINCLEKTFCVKNSCKISYNITDYERYYYPVWVIETIKGGESRTIYLSDVDSSIGGNNIPSRIDDAFSRTFWAFMFVSVVIIPIFFYVMLHYHIDSKLFVCAMIIFIVFVYYMAFLGMKDMIYYDEKKLKMIAKTIYKKKNCYNEFRYKEKFEEAMKEYFK